MGSKPNPKEQYKWIHYSDADQAAKQIGSALMEFGLEPAKESFVGIYAKNRPEVITFSTCFLFNFIQTKIKLIS